MVAPAIAESLACVFEDQRQMRIAHPLAFVEYELSRPNMLNDHPEIFMALQAHGILSSVLSANSVGTFPSALPGTLRDAVRCHLHESDSVNLALCTKN